MSRIGPPPPLEPSPLHAPPAANAAAQALQILGGLLALQTAQSVTSTKKLPPGRPYKSGKKKKPKKPNKKGNPVDPPVRRPTKRSTATSMKYKRGRTYTKTQRRRRRRGRKKKRPTLPKRLFKSLMRAARNPPQEWNLYTAQRYFQEASSVNGCQVQSHSHFFYIDPENNNLQLDNRVGLNALMNDGFKQMTAVNPVTLNAESAQAQRTMIFKNAFSIYRIRNNTNTDCELWLWTATRRHDDNLAFFSVSDANVNVETHGDQTTDNTWFVPTLTKQNRKMFWFSNLRKFKLVPGQEIQYTIRGIGGPFSPQRFTQDPKTYEKGRKFLLMRLHGAIANGGIAGEDPVTNSVGITSAAVDVRHYFQMHYKLLSNSTMIYNHEYRPPIEPANVDLISAGMDTVTEAFSKAAG